MIAMDEITIRPARPSEAGAIAGLDVETWRETYPGMLPERFLVGLSRRRREIAWREAILIEPGDVLVAVDGGGAVLGFGSCGSNRGDRSYAGEVFTLYVGPDWQNRGIGRRLLCALFARLVAKGRTSAIIWVLAANPSRFFYARLGGREVSRKRFPVGGALVEAAGYGWRDLPRYLAGAASENRGPLS
jgi:ribosomal protein S18 acetylase RimI-like enzyme